MPFIYFISRQIGTDTFHEIIWTMYMTCGILFFVKELLIISWQINTTASNDTSCVAYTQAHHCLATDGWSPLCDIGNNVLYHDLDTMASMFFTDQWQQNSTFNVFHLTCIHIYFIYLISWYSFCSQVNCSDLQFHTLLLNEHKCCCFCSLPYELSSLNSDLVYGVNAKWSPS